MQKIKYDFVIITPGRCGSEHLSETLNHFEDITVDGEIFNRANYNPDSFNYYLRKNANRLIIGFFFNRGRLSRYWINIPLRFAIRRFLRSDFRSARSTQGFKLSLDQLHAYPYVLDILLKRKCKIIYLYREDKLSQVLSLMKARNTGRYHFRVKSNTNEAYTFNAKQVSKQYKQISGWERDLMRRVTEEGFFTLSYEALFSAYRAHVSAIRNFLNLPKARNIHYSSLVKGNPNRPDTWVSNLDEIRKEVARICSG